MQKKTISSPQADMMAEDIGTGNIMVGQEKAVSQFFMATKYRRKPSRKSRTVCMK